MAHQQTDWAIFIIAGLMLMGIGSAIAPDKPLGFDMADNPFEPWVIYNPNTQTGTCVSNDPCNEYDWLTNMGSGGGTCQGNTLDTDGDGFDAWYSSGPNLYDWDSTDSGCIVLEDWDQDGVCDHRVYDSDRDQSMTPYQPVLFYHSYLGGGFWSRTVAPTLCGGWVGV